MLRQPGIVILWNLVLVTGLFGDDTVIVQLPNSRGQQTIRGTILDYAGQQLRIRTPERGTVRTVDHEHVVRIDTALTESHVRGLAELRTGSPFNAETLFQQARDAEPREWVKRDLLALLIRCDLRIDDRASAATRFLELVDDDPSTHHFGLIPLIWHPRDIPAAWVSSARLRVADRKPVHRLIGASFLLNDLKTRALGEAELQELTTCGQPDLQHLARVQLWRLKLLGRAPTASDATALERRIKSMRPELRAGPYFLLGRAWSRLERHDRAAAAYLQIPIVYADDYYLAARACLEAAESLRSAGREQEATGILREVTVRFKDTPYANEARDRLDG